jgi:hypothetical protein
MAKTLSLDANLIVLLVVGLTNTSYIGMHKRLQAYRVEDFELLKKMIATAKEVVVTPNALSEASNLSRQILDPAKTNIAIVFREIVSRTREIYVQSIHASGRHEFLRLGLADNALLEIAKEDIVILSVDANLCIAAENSGYAAINFNHHRGL